MLAFLDPGYGLGSQTMIAQGLGPEWAIEIFRVKVDGLDFAIRLSADGVFCVRV